MLYRWKRGTKGANQMDKSKLEEDSCADALTIQSFLVPVIVGGGEKMQ